MNCPVCKREKRMCLLFCCSYLGKILKVLPLVNNSLLCTCGVHSTFIFAVSHTPRKLIYTLYRNGPVAFLHVYRPAIHVLANSPSFHAVTVLQTTMPHSKNCEPELFLALLKSPNWGADGDNTTKTCTFRCVWDLVLFMSAPKSREGGGGTIFYCCKLSPARQSPHFDISFSILGLYSFLQCCNY